MIFRKLLVDAKQYEQYIELVLELPAELTVGRDGMQTVNIARHESAMRACMIHEIEWYRERVFFRLYYPFLRIVGAEDFFYFYLGADS